MCNNKDEIREESVEKLEWKCTSNRVDIISGTAYIVYIVMGGSGIDIAVRTKGETWYDGADEWLGVFPTKKEAEDYIVEYMKKNR